jgi:hypothetical protein
MHDGDEETVGIEMMQVAQGPAPAPRELAQMDSDASSATTSLDAAGPGCVCVRASVCMCLCACVHVPVSMFVLMSVSVSVSVLFVCLCLCVRACACVRIMYSQEEGMSGCRSEQCSTAEAVDAREVEEGLREVCRLVEDAGWGELLLMMDQTGSAQSAAAVHAVEKLLPVALMTVTNLNREAAELMGALERAEERERQRRVESRRELEEARALVAASAADRDTALRRQVVCVVRARVSSACVCASAHVHCMFVDGVSHGVECARVRRRWQLTGRGVREILRSTCAPSKISCRS